MIVVDVRGVVSPATALTVPVAQKKSISGGGGKFSDACAAPVWQQEVAFAGGLYVLLTGVCVCLFACVASVVCVCVWVLCA